MTTKISTANLDSSITTLIVSGGGPKVAAITYPGNDLAADTAGGQTITLTGTGFVSGCSVFVGTTQASVVTFISATSVTFTSPALAAATYTLYLVNPDGGTATIVPGVSYSGTPIWSTTAGTLGSVYEYSPISNATTATGDGSISYSVFSGTLPTGSSLNTSTGVITGTSPASAGATTYTFVIRATDAQLQDSDRTFSITVNTDTVTWTTPATTSTVTLDQNSASTTTLLATSAAGKAITYTANTLPTGMSISGATVTGTPTIVGNTTSTFTATAATTNRTATAIINWTVSVSGDTYFPYTTLLLSGATATETFIADASTNNFVVTVTGDTKPNNFNPYTPGYYSNYFDGTGDYLSTTVNLAIATGPFTMEAWVYLTALGSERTILNNLYWQSGNNGGWILLTDTSNRLWLRASTNTFNSRTTVILSSSTLAANIWYHVAVVRDSNNLVSMYFNGVSAATPVTYAASLNQGTGQLFRIGAWNPDGGSQDFWSGYISNARVVVGTAVYTGTFTPSTTPLTAIANTSLLTCQSNRFLDNSTNAYAITKVGDTTISPTTPFVPNSTYATQGGTYFDGTGDYLTIPDSGAFTIGTNNFTFECWVYPTVITSGNNNMLAQWGNGNAFIFKYIAAGRLRFEGGGGASGVSGTTTAVTVNQWNHVAITRSSSTVRLFVNGVMDATSATIGALTDGASVVAIGAYTDGSGEFVTGYISNLRLLNGTALYTTTFTPPTAPLTAITNTVLLTCQTNQPVNNSVFLDSSTNALAVTRAGNTSAGTFSPYGANWSNYFDGNADYLTVPANAALVFGTGDFTIELWFYIPGGITAPLGIIGNGTGGIDNVYWSLEGVAGGNIAFFAPNSATQYFATTTQPWTLGWAHIAVSRAGANTKLFVNGVQQGSTYTTNNSFISGGNLYIGTSSYSPGTRMMPAGYISNVRIVKGTAVYTGNFTPSTTPLTAIANTVLLTCQSNRFVDNSTNAFAVTRTGDVAVQRFSPFSPSAVYTAGTTGGSAYFDGTGDYLTTPSSSLFNLNGINWTVEGWFNLVSATSDDRLFVFAGASVSWGFYRRAATGNIYFGQMGTDEALLGNMLLNEWTHLALVRTSGPTISLYKNGVFSASTAAYSMPNENCTFLIAGNPAPYANTVTKGYVSDVRVVKGTALYTTTFTPPTAPLTAITNTSLLLNMTSAGIYDATMINDLETVGDAKRVVTQTPYAGSYYSNYFGSANYISAASNAAFGFGTGDFTVEAWVYPNAAYTAYNYIWATGANGGLVVYMLNGVLYARIYFVEDLLASSTAPALNTWTHIAVTRSGTTLRIFVNGVQTGTTTNSTNFATGSGLVGNDGANAAPWLGYISNMRVVKGTAVYTTTFTPSTTPLTAISNTSLLTCQSNRFVDNSTNAFALTVSGSPSVQSFNPFQRNSATTMYFDGTGDYLLPRAGPQYAFGTGNFTLECWIYSTNANDSPIYEGRNSGASGTAGFTLTAFSSNVIRLYAGGVLIASSGTTYVNIWTHVAVVKSGATTTLYINGTSVGTTAGLTNLTDQSPIIGGGRYSSDSTITASFTGYINDLRITNGVARYTSTFTPPTTAFKVR